jgi:glycosyltransferase involved in cell wall biosynthesis
VTSSVVIPCHNYGRFLEEAVASVDSQTRAPDEVVIIDDGSTDCTAGVLAALERRPRNYDLVVVSRSPACGAAATFNDGVRASRGEFVVILSADDRLSPAYLERCAAILRRDPSLGFAYAPARLFGAVERSENVPAFDAHELARENFVNGTAMFRRSLFDIVGGFRRDLRAWEDWEFWLSAVAKGWRGARAEGCWLEYRRHSHASRNTMSSWQALLLHTSLRRLHPNVVGWSDVAVRLFRGARRRIATIGPATP